VLAFLQMDEVRVSNQLRDELQGACPSSVGRPPHGNCVYLCSALKKSVENKQCTLCVVCQDADKNCV
jgi:hypothetical protein